ncbi:MAG: hypothetical protein IOC86_00680 [Aestuariivirga sp.]|nr:hypothetical protein [Aestuariivirga sp.]
MKGWVWGLLAVAMLALGLAILPRGADALRLLAGPRDAAAVADYALAAKRPADYVREIDAAVAAKDEDLAASLLALADERGLELPPATREAVAAAEAEATARLAADAWNGFVTGEAPNEAALAGAVAGDLTGIGDVRDLYRQAEKYLSGEEIDPLLAGLSAVGLGVTAATIASAGMAIPARSGLSTLKAVKRAGRLSPALTRQLGTLAANAIDKRAIRGLATSLEGLGTDIATIGSKAGYRATLTTLAKAESVADVSMMAKLSQRFGKATRGALLLAGGALTFASVTASAAMWSISLMLWLAAALMGLTRLCWTLGRWLAPRPKPQPA